MTGRDRAAVAGAVRHSLGTMRGRLVTLLLAAGAPLLVMAAVIALDNARLVDDHARTGLLTARDIIESRQQSFLWDSERLLAAAALGAGTPDARAALCATGFAKLLAVPGRRYAGFGLVDDQGPGCRVPTPAPAGLSAGETAAVARARASAGFAIGHVEGGPAGSGGENGAAVVLPTALPVAEHPGLILFAILNERRLLVGQDPAPLLSGLRAWLLPADAAAIPLTEPASRDVPEAADLRRLTAASNGVVQGGSVGGEPFLYAVGDLLPGLRLLVATPAGGFLSRGDTGLGWRLLELGAIFVAGLVLVTVAAELSVGQPLNRVTLAVARWRAGGRFDVGQLDRAPSEIAALAQSFAEATAALGRREAELRASAERQDLLMQEIHHRVKNNLQVVASLLNLQASRIRQPAAQAEFHAARDRIRALATLHRHLYADGELHTINMRRFLEELCQQLLGAFGETPSGVRIALAIEAPELQISSDQAVPMALLVTETVSNSVKYAFPGGRMGHIAVRLTVDRDASGQERARLTIDDDGVGIAAGQSPGERTGLGLQLIRGFARQLGASLEVTHQDGTHYVLDIPLLRDRQAEPASALDDEAID